MNVILLSVRAHRDTKASPGHKDVNHLGLVRSSLNTIYLQIAKRFVK